MGTYEAESRRKQLGWQGLTAIALAATLLVTIAFGVWLFVIARNEADSLRSQSEKIDTLTSQLSQAKSDAEDAASRAADYSGQVSDAQAQATNCKTAAAYYADALAKVALAARVGLDTSAATVYLSEAQASQASANSAGCFDG